jgi:DNA (cytosine-5)-methyltransferase 1
MSKILSLCSGYGGLDLAVEAHFTGSHTAYWSDIDPSACDIMTARFPDAEPVGDLTQFGDRKFDCSILVAGYPCQPFSQAGKRLGENDERHLWPYIANTISVSRPRWVILENVAGHLTLGGPTVVGTLTQLGYRTRFGLVSASAAGAPHQRKRLFIVAHTDSPRLQGHGTEHKLREDSSQETSRRDHSVVADTKRRSVQRQRNTRELASQEEPTEQLRRDTSTCSRENVANSESTERRGPQHEHLGTSVGSTTESRECFGETDWGEYGTAIHRWEHILGRPAPPPVKDNKLSPHFVEWMMGLEKNWVCGIVKSRAKALTALGNGVVPQQGLLALRELTS